MSPPIRVANMSLGRPAAPGFDAAMETAVNAVHAAGITVVTSAGNDPNVEASDNVPAKFASAMAIASTSAEDGNRRKCGRSNVQILADTASYFTTDGADIAISAPGEARENILKGCFIEPIGIQSLAIGGGTARMYGTSMAAPHVTGVVALMWDKADDTIDGTLDPSDARRYIENSASDIGTAPLASPTSSYTDDGDQEGILDAGEALVLTP
ncbi:MAG: S8 family serine peptidase [SAR202 cluster bacterium]|nr:S8 family serine peptidase [SAR202 cluster bacterium]MDP6662757.1 S8 family serine peptidase [SAR202 cluster bacterium]MDP6800644.1 S8 family serine peptidase [SAR202 cluster bacterium]